MMSREPAGKDTFFPPQEEEDIWEREEGCAGLMGRRWTPDRPIQFHSISRDVHWTLISDSEYS